MYKKIKLKKFKLIGSAKDINSKIDFKEIDNYENSISKYIYSNIEYTDYTEPIEKALQSRLQALMSSILLRSILLKQGIVSALNDNNFPAYYAVLKSFLEVPAMLGYICSILSDDNETREILKKMEPLILGNRDAGTLPVGNVKALNVLTMFEKAGEEIKKIGLSDSNLTDEQRENIKKEENVLLTDYSYVSNFGHINYNAHLSVGMLYGNIWKAKRDAKGYKGELYSFYMPAFMVGIRTIKLFCFLILKNQRVNDFNLLNNKNYKLRYPGFIFW